jgi:iron-sulfur cluster assembly accessory protein
MITISNLAKLKIKEMITNNLGKATLLYINGSGCNGFSYKFKILKEDQKPHKLDEIVKIDDYNMYICGKSLIYIIGTNIDYKEDMMGPRFDFSSKQIDSKCGCGTSVNFKVGDTPTPPLDLRWDLDLRVHTPHPLRFKVGLRFKGSHPTPP